MRFIPYATKLTTVTHIETRSTASRILECTISEIEYSSGVGQVHTWPEIISLNAEGDAYISGFRNPSEDIPFDSRASLTFGGLAAIDVLRHI